METLKRYENHVHFFKWNCLFSNTNDCSPLQDEHNDHGHLRSFKITDIKKIKKQKFIVYTRARVDSLPVPYGRFHARTQHFVPAVHRFLPRIGPSAHDFWTPDVTRAFPSPEERPRVLCTRSFAGNVRRKKL